MPCSLVKWWLFQRYKVHYQSYSFNQPPFHFTFGLFLLARYRSMFLLLQKSINTVEIHLPPLRERTGDVPLLTNHFVKHNAKKYKKSIKGISSAAMKTLNQYSWPGNVRELQHAIERAIILSDSEILQPENFILSSPKKMRSEIKIDTLNLEDVEKAIITKAMKKQFQYQV